MVFAHDTEAALTSTAALVNTTGDGHDTLTDMAALDEFLRANSWTGRRDNTDAELRAVRALRPRLREIWYADEDGVVDIVNRLLREAKALPQLVRHGHGPYHLHATSAEAPLAVRMTVEAAMALIDVVRLGELSRLRTCEFPGCGSVVVDLSKNRSRRFCDAGCGNRAAVTAYRARKARTGKDRPVSDAPA